MNRKNVFIATAVILLTVFVVGAFIYVTIQRDRAAQQALQNREALVRLHAPTQGPAAAPVTIVEFLDPACETCRAFYPAVKQMLAAEPQRLRLVLRYAPFHPGSDGVVALLEAARRQGKFWETLETLLANQSAWTVNHTARLDLAWPHVAGLGLDVERLRQDMADPAIAAVIAQDRADAAALNVTQTPEFFVNGRPLPSFGYEQLRTLVADELARAR